MASATERTMTHPSPTAYPEREIFRRGRYAQCQVLASWRDKPPKYIACYEPGRGDHFVAKQALGTWCEVELSEVLTHIAALEAEYAECRKLLLSEMAKNVVGKAEAQLATRLPTEAQISYLLEVLAKEGVTNGGGDFMRRKISKAILALLSGAATPAPTAALTEEEREQRIAIVLTAFEEMHDAAAEASAAYNVEKFAETVVSRLTGEPSA